MNVWEAIRNRHSYRGKYLPTLVPREHLTWIMQAGAAAPSGCNKQTTSFLAVDDPEVMKQLLALVQLPAEGAAPAMICVLARKIIAYQDRTFYVQDYAAAIENMLLAIVALGYESCWYEGRITGADPIGRRMACILGVPEEYELVCFLPVGVAAEAVKGPKKLPLEERCRFNFF